MAGIVKRGEQHRTAGPFEETRPARLHAPNDILFLEIESSITGHTVEATSDALADRALPGYHQLLRIAASGEITAFCRIQTPVAKGFDT
jgi:hypothetical protein